MNKHKVKHHRNSDTKTANRDHGSLPWRLANEENVKVTDRFDMTPILIKRHIIITHANGRSPHKSKQSGEILFA